MRGLEHLKPSSAATVAAWACATPENARQLAAQLSDNRPVPSFSLRQARDVLYAMKDSDGDVRRTFFALPLASQRSRPQLFDKLRPRVPALAVFETYDQAERLNTLARTAIGDKAAVTGLLSLAKRIGEEKLARAVDKYWAFHLGRANPAAQDFLVGLLDPQSSAEAAFARVMAKSEDIPLLAALPVAALDEMSAALRACNDVPPSGAWQLAQDVLAERVARTIGAEQVAMLSPYVDGQAIGLAVLPDDRLQMLVAARDAIADSASHRIRPLDVRGFARAADPQTYLAKFVSHSDEADVAAMAREPKVFASLDELVASDAVYSHAYQTTLDSDNRQMLSVHMNRAARRALQLAKAVGLAPELQQVLCVAGKLHDLGKLDEGPQEETNVSAARAQLARVADLDPDTTRQVLLLIRYDELLGEILKGCDCSSLTEFAQVKRDQLGRIFGGTPALERALVVLYLADIQSKGVDLFTKWNIGPKLEFLGYGDIVTEARRLG